MISFYKGGDRIEVTTKDSEGKINIEIRDDISGSDITIDQKEIKELIKFLIDQII